MISYLLAISVVSMGCFYYGQIMDEMDVANDCNPHLEESDFIDLNPFRNWK